jgi:hypothetical protein
MFVICSLVLVAVSLMTPVPERRKLGGLTFATVDALSAASRTSANSPYQARPKNTV